MARHQPTAGTFCAAASSAALWLGASVAAQAAAPVPAPAPDVDALVTYETRQVTSAGVTRTERWQERLVRRAGVVWTARVLPAGLAALHPAERAPERPNERAPERANERAAEHAGHKHFDFDTAARLVERPRNGELRLRFVDREHKVVVSVPKAEYGAVGFDGNWEAAAYIVPPTVAARMGAAAADGWRTEKAKGWSHKLRWSTAQQLPLRVESRRDDGNVTRLVTVTPVAATAALPWRDIDAFDQKEYDDFMD